MRTFIKLSTLSLSHWLGLTSLTVLLMQHNSITSLSAGVFKDLKSVTEMSINDNAISSLDVATFEGMNSLKYLWIHNNSLRSLPAEIFSFTPKLRHLNISHNELIALSQDMFSLGGAHPTWFYLAMSGNAIPCNASSCWMIDEAWLSWWGDSPLECTGSISWPEFSVICGGGGRYLQIITFLHQSIWHVWGLFQM